MILVFFDSCWNIGGTFESLRGRDFRNYLFESYPNLKGHISKMYELLGCSHFQGTGPSQKKNDEGPEGPTNLKEISLTKRDNEVD